MNNPQLISSHWIKLNTKGQKDKIQTRQDQAQAHNFPFNYKFFGRMFEGGENHNNAKPNSILIQTAGNIMTELTNHRAGGVLRICINSC